MPLATVRAQAKAGDMGAQLLCTVAEGDRKRVYIEADHEQMRAADVERPDDAPETDLPEQALGFRVQGYGITKHRAAVHQPSARQPSPRSADLVAEARKQVIADGGDERYADAVATYLGLGISRLANRCSSQSFWHAGRRRQSSRSSAATHCR